MELPYSSDKRSMRGSSEENVELCEIIIVG